MIPFIGVPGAVGMALISYECIWLTKQVLMV
jgi:hypothetical protein